MVLLLMVLFLSALAWTESYNPDPYRPLASEKEAVNVQVFNKFRSAPWTDFILWIIVAIGRNKVRLGDGWRMHPQHLGARRARKDK